jgi:hypothetical protein
MKTCLYFQFLLIDFAILLEFELVCNQFLFLYEEEFNNEKQNFAGGFDPGTHLWQSGWLRW